MGNFSESGDNWDLLMEVAPGDLRPTLWGQPDSVSRTQSPAVVELQENTTVRYPKLIVRPHRAIAVTE